MANQQLTDNQQIPYSVRELDPKLNPAPIGQSDRLNVSSADTDSITIIPDATPAPGILGSGILVAGSKEQVGVAVTFALARTGGAAVPPTILLIDVIGDQVSSLEVTLGTAVPQGAAPSGGGGSGV